MSAIVSIIVSDSDDQSVVDAPTLEKGDTGATAPIFRRLTATQTIVGTTPTKLVEIGDIALDPSSVYEMDVRLGIVTSSTAHGYTLTAKVSRQDTGSVGWNFVGGTLTADTSETVTKTDNGGSIVSTGCPSANGYVCGRLVIVTHQYPMFLALMINAEYASSSVSTGAGGFVLLRKVDGAVGVT